MPESRKPWLKRALSWPWKAFVWLKNRRGARTVARSIASNQIATAALAASVAAAGIGGVATYSAHQAQSDTKKLAQHVATIDADSKAAHVALAEMQHSVDTLKGERAQDMKNLASQLAKMSAKVKAVGDDVAALPPSVDSTPSIEAAAALAQQAKDAANSALAAAQSAEKNATDSEARAAAKEAQKAAQDAATKAQAAKDAADYAPHVYHIQNTTLVADVPERLIGHLDVDFTGDYKITLSADGTGYAYNWYVNGATIYLAGYGGEGTLNHQNATTTFTFNGPIGIDIKGSATGGDTIDLTNVLLTITKVRS